MQAKSLSARDRMEPMVLTWEPRDSATHSLTMLICSSLKSLLKQIPEAFSVSITFHWANRIQS